MPEKLCRRQLPVLVRSSTMKLDSLNEKPDMTCSSCEVRSCCSTSSRLSSHRTHPQQLTSGVLSSNALSLSSAKMTRPVKFKYLSTPTQSPTVIRDEMSTVQSQLNASNRFLGSMSTTLSTLATTKTTIQRQLKSAQPSEPSASTAPPSSLATTNQSRPNPTLCSGRNRGQTLTTPRLPATHGRTSGRQYLKQTTVAKSSLRCSLLERRPLSVTPTPTPTPTITTHCLPLTASHLRQASTQIQRHSPSSRTPSHRSRRPFSVTLHPSSTRWLMLLSYTLLAFLAVSAPSFTSAQQSIPQNSTGNIRQLEKKILDKIIGIGTYDSRIRPSGNISVTGASEDGPAMIYVNLLIRSISRIDDVVMEYSVQVTFREQWIDSRLRFNNRDGSIRYLVLTDPNRVWRPDLFFKNEKEGHFHDIIMPNVLLRIYPDGMVLYSIRISLVLACPMDLKYYPLDKQVCSIQMASYGYTTEDLMFVWKEKDPVQITTNLHLPRFTLEKYLTAYCTSTTNTGSYSCLKVDLLFKREFSYYLIQIYIPCCMLVIVSWVSFWLDPNAIPARVSLGVTTLLTMATSISGINSSLPPVSYTKAIDVWTGVCLTFVFGALLEFALVNYASRSDAHRAALKQQHAAFSAQRKWDIEHAAALESGEHIDERTASAFAMRPLVRQPGAGGGGGGGNGNGDNFHNDKMRACEIHVTLPKRNWCKRWLSKFPTRSKRIDVISRIFFPLMFALFNLVYWTTYLFREDMQDLTQ